MPTLSPSAPKFFREDMQAYEAVLRTAGAVLPPDPQDGFIGLDPTILSQVQTTYANLCSYGWANGWLAP